MNDQLYLQQAMFMILHFFDGTHKLEEPVSKTTLKLCGGVPIEIGPKYCAWNTECNTEFTLEVISVAYRIKNLKMCLITYFEIIFP